MSSKNTSPTPKDPCNWPTVEVRHCKKGNCPVELSYQTFGNATDPAVLLVMGLGGQGIIWGEGFCRLIAQAGYYVIRFDNRDIGFSTKFDHMKCAPMWHLLMPECCMNWKAPYSLVDMAEDAVCLLKKIGVKDNAAHWVGCSMGGMIAQTAAIHFPESVLSLTSMMSTTGNKKLPDPKLSTQLWFMKQPKSQAYDDIIAHKVAFAKAILCTGIKVDSPEMEKMLEDEAKVQVDRSQYDLGTTRQLFSIRTAPCRDAALARLRMPTLVLHGPKDVLVPKKHGEATAAAILKGRTADELAENGGPHRGLRWVEKMGHHIGPYCYHEVMAEMLPFLKDADARHAAPVKGAASTNVE